MARHRSQRFLQLKTPCPRILRPAAWAITYLWVCDVEIIARSDELPTACMDREAKQGEAE